MQIQNLDDFLFFVFFTFTLDFTRLKKTCIVLSLRDFAHVLVLPHLDTE